MIILTKLNKQEICLNDDLIETMDENPDTVIVTTTGNKYVVKETKEEVIKKIIAYKRQIFSQLGKE